LEEPNPEFPYQASTKIKMNICSEDIGDIKLQHNFYQT